MTIAQNLKALGPYFVGQVVGIVEPEQERPAELETARRWHVVQVRPQGEATIGEEIEKGGVAVYVPQEHGRIAQRTMRGRRWRDVVRPMFPGYVFAGFDPAGERWKIITAIEGVVRLLMFDARAIYEKQAKAAEEAGDPEQAAAWRKKAEGARLRPVPVAEHVMMRVHNIEAELAEEGGRRRKVSGLRLGSVVQLRDTVFDGLAAFGGWMGVIVAIDRKARTVTAEVDLFGRRVRLTLPPENVVVVGGADGAGLRGANHRTRSPA